MELDAACLQWLRHIYDLHMPYNITETYLARMLSHNQTILGIMSKVAP